MAVDFILGRGWRGGKNRWSLSASSLHAAEAATEVEQAFLDAPSSALVALVEDPLKHFEFDDLLCAHQYVMEHRLYCWICNQNNDHGVAPSREQLLARALASIPVEAPEQVRSLLSRFLTGKPRKQRKWLARFRKRWGARIGFVHAREEVPLPLRRQKAGLVGKMLAVVVYGIVHVASVGSIFGVQGCRPVLN